MIRVSDETLDSFIALRRKALNREYGSAAWRTWPAFERGPLRAAGHGKALHAAAGEKRTMDCLIIAARRRAYARRGACRGRRPLLGLCQRRRRRGPRPFRGRARPGLLRLPRTIRRVRGRRRLLKSRVALAGPAGAELRCGGPRRAPPFRTRPPKPCAPAPPRRGNDRPDTGGVRMDFSALVARQRAYFESGATRGADFRLAALKSLREALVKNEALIFDALKADLNKAPMESYMCENGLVLEEIRFHLKHLRHWMKERRVPTPLAQFHASSFVSPEPYGVALILSPWNYPIQLCLSPLVGAISAGNNCAVVKPSAYAPATSAAIAKVLGRRSRRNTSPWSRRPRPEQRPAGGKVRLYFHRLRRRRQGGDGGRRPTPHSRDAGTGRQKPGHRRCDGEYPARRPAALPLARYRNAIQTCVEPDISSSTSPSSGSFVEAFRAALERVSHRRLLRTCPPSSPKSTTAASAACWRGKDHPRRWAMTTRAASSRPTLLADISRFSHHAGGRFFGPILPMLPYESLDEASPSCVPAPARWPSTSSRPAGRRNGGCWTVVLSAAALAMPSSPHLAHASQRRGRFRRGRLPRTESFDTFTYGRHRERSPGWDLPTAATTPAAGKLKLIRFMVEFQLLPPRRARARDFFRVYGIWGLTGLSPCLILYTNKLQACHPELFIDSKGGGAHLRADLQAGARADRLRRPERGQAFAVHRALARTCASASSPWPRLRPGFCRPAISTP